MATVGVKGLKGILLKGGRGRKGERMGKRRGRKGGPLARKLLITLAVWNWPVYWGPPTTTELMTGLDWMVTCCQYILMRC